MRAGNLDRRITIQRRESGQDASGQPSGAWVNVATVWAEFTPLTGRERFTAQRVQAELSARFRIRHHPGLHPKMRVRFDGDLYEIEAVLEHGRRREIELLVSAVVPQEVA